MHTLRNNCWKDSGGVDVISNRCGIKQKNNWRVVDDLSDRMVNACFGATESIDLGGVDEVAVLSRKILRTASADRKVEIKLSTGKLLRGVLHISLTVAQATALVGRTLDLESAYKQLLVARGSAWGAVLNIFNFEEK